MLPVLMEGASFTSPQAFSACGSPAASQLLGKVVSFQLQVRSRLPEQSHKFSSLMDSPSAGTTKVMPRPARLRLCLITPGHLSTDPRLAKEADATSAAGYSVQVLACDYLGWARSADREFRARPWRLAPTVQFGPLAPFAMRLKQGIRRRMAREFEKWGMLSDGLVNAAWHPAGPELARAASEIEADLYIAHYPAALPAAAHAARRNGGRYAFDAEDFHLGDVPEEPHFDQVRRLTRAIEARYLPGAAYMTAASPDIADAYVEAYGVERPTVLLNVFPRAEALSAPTPRGEAQPGRSVYWFSQTIGPDRGLECALQAIAQARSRPHLYLRGHCAAGYQARLDDLARSLGCSEAPPLPRSSTPLPNGSSRRTI